MECLSYLKTPPSSPELLGKQKLIVTMVKTHPLIWALCVLIVKPLMNVICIDDIPPWPWIELNCAYNTNKY